MGWKPELLKVASAWAALEATSPVVEPYLHPLKSIFGWKNLNFYTCTHHITKYFHNNVFIAPNWTQLKFLTLLCKVFGFWYQMMSRITVFSCQILCNESRCFWSQILTLQKATGATKQLFSNSGEWVSERDSVCERERERVLVPSFCLTFRHFYFNH